MRYPTRSNSTLAPAALVALSLAVCLGSTATGQTVVERRTSAESEQAVASLLASIEAAARHFVGQTVAVLETTRPTVVPPRGFAADPPRLGHSPPIALAVHLSRLNLPPPADV